MNAPAAADVDSLDLADPMLHANYNLADVWRHLRDEKPVHWNACADGPVPGFWVITRYADVVAAYRNVRGFSSQQGNLLTSLLQGGDTASGQMLPVTDGRRHSAIRSLLAPSLGPRTLDRLGTTVAATTHDLLTAAISRGEFDFARDVAAHIPLMTICDLIGVPDSDRAFIKQQAAMALGSDEPEQSMMESWLARNEILLYFRELSRTRRAAPQDDLISVLATGLVDGAEIGEDEIILNCYSLILGGDETTRLSMGGAVAAFAAAPDEWTRLRDGEVTVATAVEEVLRWTAAAMHAGRTATEDTVLHDVAISAGDVVTMWNVAANRDEREFAEPDRFDLGRTANRHVTFGYGSHFCLGASLARVEIAALLTTLRTLVCTIELTGEPRRIFSNFLGGYSSVPVAFAGA